MSEVTDFRPNGEADLGAEWGTKPVAEPDKKERKEIERSFIV